MTKLKVNKIEAAQRQIDTAIRLLFDNEDPVSIHTLAMAGFRILRDLAHKHNSNMNRVVKSRIKPVMEGKFWGTMQSFANFLKHANKDPDGIIDDVHEEINDAILFLTTIFYRDLGYQFTPEMLALHGWFSVIHPDVLSQISPDNFRDQLKATSIYLVGKPRKEQLAQGKEVLKIARLFFNKQ